MKGSFKLEDSLIILHDEAGAMACSGSATRGEYWWNLSQGHITFERVHDFCRLRAWFLDRARLNVAENTGLY